MWPSPISEINADTILRLLDSKVEESRHLEFKREPPGKTSGDGTSFLLDVVAFANSGGGYILYGITEEAPTGDRRGRAESLLSIQDNLDELKRHLLQLVKDLIEPRLHVEMVALKVHYNDLDYDILAIRVPSSVLAPHAVRSGDGFKFPYRTSGGRTLMDLLEVKRAWSASDGRTLSIDRHIQERYSLHRPTFYRGGYVLTIIPLNLDRSEDVVSTRRRSQLAEAFKPILSSGYNDRYNLDGFLTYTPDAESTERVRTSTQLFRNGTIESVVNRWGEFSDTDTYVDKTTNKTLLTVIEYMRSLELMLNPFPCVIALSINIRAKDVVKLHSQLNPGYTDKEDILLPHILIPEKPVSWQLALKPLFDVLWNAFGYSRCPAYDTDGSWMGLTSNQDRYE